LRATEQLLDEFEKFAGILPAEKLVKATPNRLAGDEKM
jgi:hypothetical protein